MITDTAATFTGFDTPKSNYHKIPNILWDMELNIYERSIMQYLMRHTWGYQEFGITKHITLDEFQNGRKEADGSRIDKGVSFSKSMISRTLQHLEQRGFIYIETDARDKARIRKSYGIVIQLPQGEHSVHGENTAFTPETQRSPGERDQRKKLKKETTEKETDRKTDKTVVANPVPVAVEPVEVLSVYVIPVLTDEDLFEANTNGVPALEKYQPVEAMAVVPVEVLPVEVKPLPIVKLLHNDLTHDDRIIPGLKPGDKPLYKPDDTWIRVQQLYEDVTGLPMSGKIQDDIQDGIKLRGEGEVTKLLERARSAKTSRVGMVVKALENWQKDEKQKKHHRKEKEPGSDIVWNADGSIGGYR